MPGNEKSNGGVTKAKTPQAQMPPAKENTGTKEHQKTHNKLLETIFVAE